VGLVALALLFGATVVPAARAVGEPHPTAALERSPSGAVAHGLLVSAAPTRPAASVGSVITIPQTLNNCGPASVAEVLAYWGIHRSQGQVQAVLRADKSPWGMAPYGIPGYARSLGMQGLIAASGTLSQIKALISNGFPVIVNQWVSASDHIRHYRVIDSYSDRTRQLVSSDPYLGPGHAISYAEFAAIWAPSNDRFVVLYPPSRAAKLQAVLRAAGWDRTAAYTRELAWQRQRMRAGATDPSGWFQHNRFVALAFDEAMVGRYRQAEADLTAAARAGSSPIMIGWVREDMRLLSNRSAS
jgi:predicted double-glycine peptidase